MRRGEIQYAKVGDHHIAHREYAGDRGGEHEIVMVTGGNWPMDSLTEDPVADRLLEGLADLGRLVVFDRRGIALSDPLTDWDTPIRDQWAEDLAAVITASGCDRPTVFSWGAVPVAQSCAVRHPGLIGRLVLFNPPSPPTDADADWLARFVEGQARLRAGDPANPGRSDDPSCRSWSDAAGRAGASPSLAERLAEKNLADPWFDNTQVAVPTLVITRSPPDWVVPAEYFRRASDANASAGWATPRPAPSGRPFGAMAMRTALGPNVWPADSRVGRRGNTVHS